MTISIRIVKNFIIKTKSDTITGSKRFGWTHPKFGKRVIQSIKKYKLWIVITSMIVTIMALSLKIFVSKQSTKTSPVLNAHLSYEQTLASATSTTPSFFFTNITETVTTTNNQLYVKHSRLLLNRNNTGENAKILEPQTDVVRFRYTFLVITVSIAFVVSLIIYIFYRFLIKQHELERLFQQRRPKSINTVLDLNISSTRSNRDFFEILP
ncbi:unnamed protein product [Didymodactylos carnosus]|uniref:Uncharacterized protein n=1 Tax=Didymodactylos carnosus TaxID=1234261 RepID=A0A813XD20_9BILA|nr:unnamed protein product [Didymodactylos carnosus]CAF1362896.1 unnamed protein product [Didymodactylos carnosus]CAF3652635.1 unnamed protein product [Didymodactylos carnosus]CAF4172628.1 unnamed protein product [Didymodactylos carnosus]